MLKIFFALAIAMAAGPAVASEKADVTVPVHPFIDGFNKGDAKTALAACAAPASIVDEFPPYAWQGPAACSDWANAFAANSKKSGISSEFVTLGKPSHVDVAGDRAYVVVPATYTYKQHGKMVTESGSMFTVALKKFEAWRIVGWAWTKH